MREHAAGFADHGAFTSRLACTMALSYTGVDHSEIAIEESRMAHEGPTFVLADARKLPFPDNSFDIGISIATLSYLGRDFAKGFEEISRVSREGIILQLVHDSTTIRSREKREKTGFGSIITIMNFETAAFTDEGLVAEMAKLGFAERELRLERTVDGDLDTHVLVTAMRRRV